jgi:hypothetical protein
MPRVTTRFLNEIRRSHTVYAYVDVTSPNQETIRLPATQGDVSVDRTAAIRRSCQVTCIDPLGQLVPKDKDSVLTPYGTEIRPYRGVKYTDGTIEVAPLGVFRIAKATVEDGGQTPQIKIESFDRSRAVARDKFTSPYVIAPDTNVVTAIKDILARTYPDLEYDAISSPVTTTASKVYDVGDDPWDEVTLLATSIGCEVYFDVEGRVVIAPSPDIDALPTADFTYIEGQGCTMTELTRVFTDEPGFNGVIVTGESPGDELPPVRGEAWDEEPTSATYRLGPYGEVPMFHTDQVVKTTEEAETVARQLLNSQLGFSSQLSITATVNPALEAGDVVEVVRAASHVSGLYVVDAFNVPLDKGGSQGLTLRQKRVTA